MFRHVPLVLSFLVRLHSTATRTRCNFDKRGYFVILQKLNGDSFLKRDDIVTKQAGRALLEIV
jgi:hypothetical protein